MNESPWCNVNLEKLNTCLKHFAYATHVVYIPYDNLDRESQSREAHRWLQEILSSVLGIPVSCLQFKRTSLGELYAPGIKMGFSISHCPQGVLISVSPIAVGVDMVQSKKRPYLQALHERTSHLELLVSYPKPSVQDILTLWSGKEAVLKAAGVGLKIEPSKLKMKLYKSLIYQVVYVGRKPYWLTWLPKIADMIFSLSLAKRSPLLLWKICSK
ncbi:4'-phosphopantetheinyl transferase family protein [Zooshikella sp. RANM57]|uniref:4'-phosphopantetheinyl transferase family protein n=1 Tax=Zooshikella sp. RANM57 TaxID=3425863 RepID=UPI003D6EA7C9